jgi:hypothetical protein
MELSPPPHPYYPSTALGSARQHLPTQLEAHGIRQDHLHRYLSLPTSNLCKPTPKIPPPKTVREHRLTRRATPHHPAYTVGRQAKTHHDISSPPHKATRLQYRKANPNIPSRHSYPLPHVAHKNPRISSHLNKLSPQQDNSQRPTTGITHEILPRPLTERSTKSMRPHEKDGASIPPNRRPTHIDNLTYYTINQAQ